MSDDSRSSVDENNADDGNNADDNTTEGIDRAGWQEHNNIFEQEANDDEDVLRSIDQLEVDEAELDSTENEVRGDFVHGHIVDEYSTALAQFDVKQQIVQAKFFTNINRQPKDYENKVVIGTLLHMAVPSNSGMVVGRATGKKDSAANFRVPSTSLILFFGDQFDMPNCFALMIKRRTDFNTLFGAGEIARSTNVQVGKKYALKEPTPSDDYLGKSIVMIKDPGLIVEIKDKGWSKCDLLPSYEGNWQTWFEQDFQQIYVAKPRLLTGEQNTRIMCKGYTCDMQGGCRGCYGTSAPKKPIVLKCNVDVLHCKAWESSTGNAPFYDFTSYNFTSLFLKDAADLATKHSAVIASMHGMIRSNVPKMVALVNKYGGWTVIGWHRRGTNSTEDGEEYTAAHTRAHLISLKPSDPRILRTGIFRALMIRTPTDDRVPTAIPPVIMHPVELRGAGSTASSCHSIGGTAKRRNLGAEKWAASAIPRQPEGYQGVAMPELQRNNSSSSTSGSCNSDSERRLQVMNTPGVRYFVLEGQRLYVDRNNTVVWREDHKGWSRVEEDYSEQAMLDLPNEIPPPQDNVETSQCV